MDNNEIKALTFREILEKYRTPREKKITWFRHIYRYTGVFITKILLGTTITPNQISFSALFIGIAGTLLLLPQDYLIKVAGILLIQFSFALDFADGTLARIKGLSSSRGDYLDAIVNSFVATLVFFCLGLANYHLLEVKALIFGFGAAAGALFVKFCYAIKLKSVLSLEREKVREVLNSLQDNPALSQSQQAPTTGFNKFIIKTEYVIFNYMYVLNYVTLAVIFKADCIVLAFYGIFFPLYAFLVFLRLFKVSSKEILDWIINPKRIIN